MGCNLKEHSKYSHALLVTTKRRLLPQKSFLMISALLILQEQHQCEWVCINAPSALSTPCSALQVWPGAAEKTESTASTCCAILASRTTRRAPQKALASPALNTWLEIAYLVLGGFSVSALHSRNYFIPGNWNIGYSRMANPTTWGRIWIVRKADETKNNNNAHCFLSSLPPQNRGTGPCVKYRYTIVLNSL